VEIYHKSPHYFNFLQILDISCLDTNRVEIVKN